MKIIKELNDGWDLRDWYINDAPVKIKPGGYLNKEGLIEALDMLGEEPTDGWDLLFNIIEDVFGEELQEEFLSAYIADYQDIIETYSEDDD